MNDTYQITNVNDEPPKYTLTITPGTPIQRFYDILIFWNPLLN